MIQSHESKKQQWRKQKFELNSTKNLTCINTFQIKVFCGSTQGVYTRTQYFEVTSPCINWLSEFENFIQKADTSNE